MALPWLCPNATVLRRVFVRENLAPFVPQHTWLVARSLCTLLVRPCIVARGALRGRIFSSPFPLPSSSLDSCGNAPDVALECGRREEEEEEEEEEEALFPPSSGASSF